MVRVITPGTITDTAVPGAAPQQLLCSPRTPPPPRAGVALRGRVAPETSGPARSRGRAAGAARGRARATARPRSSSRERAIAGRGCRAWGPTGVPSRAWTAGPSSRAAARDLCEHFRVATLEALRRGRVTAGRAAPRRRHARATCSETQGRRSAHLTRIQRLKTGECMLLDRDARSPPSSCSQRCRAGTREARCSASLDGTRTAMGGAPAPAVDARPLLDPRGILVQPGRGRRPGLRRPGGPSRPARAPAKACRRPRAAHEPRGPGRGPRRAISSRSGGFAGPPARDRGVLGVPSEAPVLRERCAEVLDSCSGRSESPRRGPSRRAAATLRRAA